MNVKIFFYNVKYKVSKIKSHVFYIIKYYTLTFVPVKRASVNDIDYIIYLKLYMFYFRFEEEPFKYTYDTISKLIYIIM